MVVTSSADSRLWRTPSETGESDLSSREWPDCGDISATALGAFGYASTCGGHVVEGAGPSSLGLRGEPNPIGGEKDNTPDVKPALPTNGAGPRKGVGARRSGKGSTTGYERPS